MSASDISAIVKQIPGIQLDENQPVFNEPWEAQVFALTVSMHDKGLFEWKDWAEVFGAALAEDDDQHSYYEVWLQALEIFLSKQSFLDGKEIADRSCEWEAALLATPHGAPIELKNGNM